MNFNFDGTSDLLVECGQNWVEGWTRSRILEQIEGDPHKFRSFPKVPRLNREIIITEKIDGTNGQIYIGNDFETFKVGSRNKWITPENDNYGFAKWAYANKEELMALGPGRHYGEWWGLGIQREYGLGQKRFSLFNTTKWNRDNIPVCCDVVPVLAQGLLEEELMCANMRYGEYEGGIENQWVRFLYCNGSVAAPGFRPAEGIMIYHVASGHYYKRTIENDEKGKEQ